MSESYQLGRKGVAEAARFLIQNNYKILEKNYRYRKAEVDLIVQKNKVDKVDLVMGYSLNRINQKSSHYLM